MPRKLREATAAANVYPGLLVPIGMTRRQWPLQPAQDERKRKRRSRRKRGDPGYLVPTRLRRFTTYPFPV